MQIYKKASILSAMLMLSAITTYASAQSVTVDVKSNLDSSFIDAFNSYLQTTSSNTTTFNDLIALDKLVKNASINGNKLTVNFDETLLNDFMQDNNITKLETISDPILVWLTKVDNNGSSIVTDTHDLASILNDASNLHNLRLMYPLMDLDDVQLVSENTILSHNDEALAKASNRYGSDYFIAGAISYGDSTIEAKLNLYYKDGSILDSKDFKDNSTAFLDSAIRSFKVSISKDIQKRQENEKALATNTDTKDEGLEIIDKVAQDITLLGPSKDFVRFKILNVTSLHDIAQIKHLFITYGYDDNSNIVRIDDGALIIELKTHSNPMILDGTMRKSGDFTKLSSWTYTYKHAHKNNSNYNTLIKKNVNSTFVSDINYK